MGAGFLFGWAKEQNIKVPTKSDGSANINELFALYNEWKKKQTSARRATLRDKGIDTDGMDDAAVEQRYEEYTGKTGGVVELDENSELARLIASSDRNKYDTIRRYLIENFGGRELELSDGKKAVIDKSDAKELAHKAYDRRVAELSMLENLASKARFIGQANNVQHNKFHAFRYYEVKTRYKGEDGGILLNVGIHAYDKTLHLYAITNRK